jgi:hypothetical protein
MDPSDSPNAQVLSVEQGRQDDRHRILESAISTVSAVKRLVAEYDRMKEERDRFERQISTAIAENESLRKQMKDATGHRENLLKALESLGAQMGLLGARCTEAIKVVRAQSNEPLPAIPTGPQPADSRTPLERPAVADASAIPAAQRPSPTGPDTGRGQIGGSLGGAQVFTQYLAQ